MWLVLKTVLIFNIFMTVHAFFRYPKQGLRQEEEITRGNVSEVGTPLFLTPYIEIGNIREGRRLAMVPFTESLRIKSYAGFFTVNKAYNSNQFFWYFPAIISNNKNAPVLVWLQGGPGSSSLFGLFLENGPIRVHHGKFQRWKYNWAISHHIIYIDNPVGTGFSFTNDSKGYCTDETQVGEQLYSTVTQFFELFPELRQNNFFVTGESYAGKYVPALAYTIHKKNPTAEVKINLKGIAIGNGLCDPVNQLHQYSKYLQKVGLIDSNQAKVVEEIEKKTRDLIKHKQWIEAFNTFDVVLNGDLIDSPTLLQNMTGFHTFVNYLQSKVVDEEHEEYQKMLQQSYVRKAIHVGNLPYYVDKEVEKHLRQDIMQSVAPWISELLEHYDIMIYNGQLDVIVAYPNTVNFLRNLNFTGANEYKAAKRYIWRVDGEVAGYVKQAGNLVEVMVRNAGHLVPHDQPKWALDMITRFTQKNKFS